MSVSSCLSSYCPGAVTKYANTVCINTYLNQLPPRAIVQWDASDGGAVLHC